VWAAAVEGFRGVAVIAEDLILGRLPVFIEEVVEGLRVVEFLLPAFSGAATLHVVNHQKFVLSNSAAWALTPAAVLDQDTLANSACAFSGSLANSFAIALSVLRGEFL
jgi:hypothetical protein